MPNPTATVMIPYHAVDDLLRRGPRAAQPVASAVTPGTLYSVSDEGDVIEQSDGTTWTAFGGAGGGTGGVVAHHVSHETGGSDALAALSAAVLTSGTVPAARMPALTGDVTSAAGTVATTIGAATITNAMLAGSITASKLVGTDLVIAESQVTNLTSDLAAKAPLASPALTGTPTASTAGYTTNTTQLATTAFVQNMFAPQVQPVNSTGFINLNMSLNCQVVYCTNAALLTVYGLKAGLDGQMVTIIAAGTGQVDLSPQNINAAAADRLINFAGNAASIATSLAAGSGSATYRYDATGARWRMVAHEQGAWIPRPYAAANYTASGSMTWTVEAGDVQTDRYRLSGRTLWWTVALVGTSVGGSPSTILTMAIPGGYLPAIACQVLGRMSDTASFVALAAISTGAAGVQIYKDLTGSTNWAVTTNTTHLWFNFVFEIS